MGCAMSPATPRLKTPAAQQSQRLNGGVFQ
jgi:hypothetical protein